MKKNVHFLLLSVTIFCATGTGMAQGILQLDGNTSREKTLANVIYQEIEPNMPDKLQNLFSRNPFVPALPLVVEPESTITTVSQTSELSRSPNMSDTQTPVPETSKIIEITPPDVLIAGIVWNTDRPQAIIDGQVVSIGDTIAGNAVITSIEKNSISITFKGHALKIKPTIGNSNQFATLTDPTPKWTEQ